MILPFIVGGRDDGGDDDGLDEVVDAAPLDETSASVPTFPSLPDSSALFPRHRRIFAVLFSSKAC